MSPTERGGSFELALSMLPCMCPFQCNFSVYIFELRSRLADLLYKTPLPLLKDQVSEHRVLLAKRAEGTRIRLCHSMAVLSSTPAPVIYYC